MKQTCPHCSKEVVAIPHYFEDRTEYRCSSCGDTISVHHNPMDLGIYPRPRKKYPHPWDKTVYR